MVDTLPPEVLAHILVFIECAEDLISLSHVSKLLQDMSSSQELWKHFCLKRYKICRVELFDNDWRKYYRHKRKTANHPVNRIVVHSLDGNYITTSPEGGDPISITTDPMESLKYYGQATWSPHGDYIAIAQYRVNSHKSNILLYNVKEKKIMHRYETPQHPFYFYWTPDSTRLSFLCNWPTHSIALHYIDITTNILKFIGAGRPYFYSFDPVGAPRLLAHFAMHNMEVIDIETNTRKSIMHPHAYSSFSAPYWISDKEIIYVYKFPRGSKHPFHDDDAFGYRPTDELLEEAYSIRLVCAIMEDPPKPANGDEGPSVKSKNQQINISEEFIMAELDNDEVELDFVCSPDSKYLACSHGSLCIIDIAARKNDKDYKAILVSHNASAFFWSPNSRYLLYNTQERHALFSHNYQWWIYDTHLHDNYQVAEFSSSPEFRQHYLPFFCQYAQSLTFFSPDSTQFVYCNDKAVHVCGVEKGSVPKRLCDGAFATWSPC